MRSSVPLGPLGEGSVELRVDGRLARWGTVFNNGPYTKDVAWAHKIDIDEAVLGVSTATLGGYRAATMLRTHPPHAPSDTSSCPSVEALAYQGGGAVARLTASLSRSVEVSLSAFSQFEMHAPNCSAALSSISHST